MRNRVWILLSLLLVTVLVLGACGGGSEPTEEAAPAAQEAAAEPTDAPAEEAVAEEEAAEEEAAGSADGPVLTIWADEVSAPVLEDIGAAFSEEYGVSLNVVQKGFGDLRSDYIVAAPTGEGPDILLGAHDWLGELNASGLLAEVSLGDKADQFAPAAVEAFTFTDGKLYGMPYATENVVLYYNTELVPEAPATFDDIKSLSQELIDGGNQFGYLIQTTDPFHFYPVQTAFGGYVFGKTEDGAWNPEDVGMNSEGTVAAFTWLDGLYEDGLLDPDGNIDGGLLLSAFQNGDAAMVISGPWALGGFRAAEVPYAIAPIPAGTEPGRPFLGARGYMINAFTENELLAQTFLQEFIASDDTMAAFYAGDPRPSAWLALADVIDDPDIVAIMAAGADADPMPNIPEMNAVWGAWGDAMELISTQKQEPQEALDNAQSQVETAIAGE